MPKLGRGMYPLRASIQWYIGYWRDRALARTENPEKGERAKLENKILAARLQERTGELILRSDVKMVTTSAYQRLGKSLDTLPGQLGKEFNWPPEVVLAVRERLDDFRRMFVADGAEFVDVEDDASGTEE